MTLTRRAAFYGLIALLLAVLVAGDAWADALSVDSLLGHWCSDRADYDFARERLTVHFHDGDQRVLPIRSFKVGDGEIKVYWEMKREGVPDEDVATIFQDFDPARGTMAQAPNTSGDMGPRIPFHRC
jgi:hypothetical protein